MPFYQQTDDDCWIATNTVDLRHLSAEGRWFKKVRFEMLTTLGYSEARLPTEHVKQKRAAAPCPKPDAVPIGLTIVDAGTKTDLASVPAFLWGVVSSYGLHTLPAIVHDTLYERARGNIDARPTERMKSRKDADDLFRKAMAQSDVPWAKRWIMWSAVRCPLRRRLG